MTVNCTLHHKPASSQETLDRNQLIDKKRKKLGFSIDYKILLFSFFSFFHLFSLLPPFNIAPALLSLQLLLEALEDASNTKMD